MFCPDFFEKCLKFTAVVRFPLCVEFLFSFDEVFVVTMFVTISFVVVLGYLMHALVSGENERVANEQAQQSSNASAQRRSSGQRSANQNKAEASRCVLGLLARLRVGVWHSAPSG